MSSLYADEMDVTIGACQHSGVLHGWLTGNDLVEISEAIGKTIRHLSFDRQ